MKFITVENQIEHKLIEGVSLHPLKVNQDESGGILVETLRTDWKDVYNEDKPFFMQYFSVTDSGIARDESVWHLHPTYQDDRFLLADGEVVVAVADKRDGSPTKEILNLFYMKATEDPYLILIPKGTLHGFLVVSKKPAILLNYPTGLYNTTEEGRVPYNEANVKMAEGELFSWDNIRKEFPALSS